MSKKYNVLIIEDNLSISNLIKNSIESPEYKIKITHSFLQAQKLILNEYFDLICLDILLPDGDGFKILEDIQKNANFKLTKVVVISQQKSLEKRVKFLQNGCHDYLPKPFFPEELNLRIKNLLDISTKSFSRINNLELNLTEKILNFENFEIKLTETEFLILNYIFSNKGFVESNNLISFLCSKLDKEINKKALNITVKRLKDKIKRRSGKHILKTRYGIGYSII